MAREQGAAGGVGVFRRCRLDCEPRGGDVEMLVVVTRMSKEDTRVTLWVRRQAGVRVRECGPVGEGSDCLAGQKAAGGRAERRSMEVGESEGVREEGEGGEGG